MAVGVLEAGLGKGTGEELLSFRSQNFIASSTANPVPHPFPAVLVSPSPGLPGAFLQGVESFWQGSGMGRAQRSSVQFSCSVVSPWTAVRQASLSITNSRSLHKLMPTESVMPSNHLILCRPLLPCPESFPASESFQMSQLFASGGQSTGVSASASVLPMTTQD